MSRVKSLVRLALLTPALALVACQAETDDVKEPEMETGEVVVTDEQGVPALSAASNPTPQADLAADAPDDATAVVDGTAADDGGGGPAQTTLPAAD